MKKTILGIMAVAGLAWLAAGQITKPFPAHWGERPKIETRDLVPLPDGYGRGSSTLAKWIAANLEKDKQAAAAGAGAAVQALYENNFEKAAVDKVPEEMMVLNGSFAVKEESGNKFLELPGAPVDDFAVMFGPNEAAGLAVQARVFGTSQRRRAPVMAVGLNGVGGYELQLAPAKKALELFKGEERVASVQCSWESGTWTFLRLQLRKVKDGEWRVEGKAWKQGAPEPAGWMINFEDKTEPPTGRPIVSGHPFSGTPIRFDDLRVTKVADKP